MATFLNFNTTTRTYYSFIRPPLLIIPIRTIFNFFFFIIWSCVKIIIRHTTTTDDLAIRFLIVRFQYVKNKLNNIKKTLIHKKICVVYRAYTIRVPTVRVRPSMIKVCVNLLLNKFRAFLFREECTLFVRTTYMYVLRPEIKIRRVNVLDDETNINATWSQS